ncbi:hypothetical protein [Bosea sp. AAP35]|uniref:hypothetical protein n=1 Tax=Bosea sp. AAP35 TaxID=1523417 RepID=UPI0012E122CF|nr:hypothetical protein [Bosea sp. AAP35]
MGHVPLIGRHGLVHLPQDQVETDAMGHGDQAIAALIPQAPSRIMPFDFNIICHIDAVPSGLQSFNAGGP